MPVKIRLYFLPIPADCGKYVIPVNKRTGTLKSCFPAFHVHVNIIPCPFPGKPAIIACPQQIGQYLQQLFPLTQSPDKGIAKLYFHKP